MKKNNKKTALKEPIGNHNKEMKIEFYKTYEEMNEAQLKDMSNLHFLERFKHMKKVILSTYNETEESLKKRTDRKKIDFIK